MFSCVRKSVSHQVSFLVMDGHQVPVQWFHTHWTLLGVQACEDTAVDVSLLGSPAHAGTPPLQSAPPDSHCSPALCWLQDSWGFNKLGLSPHSKQKRSDLARDSSFPQLPAEAEGPMTSLWSLGARVQSVLVQLLRQCRSLGHPVQERKEKVSYPFQVPAGVITWL